ncbi:MAG: hypothetical protein R3E91_04575 [Chlamydiales bacterium]
MNFTREPLIETIINAKDGYKLVLRNSRGEEEFFVDAIEVVSFGSSSFYRSLEKPKLFLVPMSEYAVIEVRQTQVVLKTPAIEKGIKIAGGRDTAVKSFREGKQSENASVELESSGSQEQKVEKRRERRRVRKRRGTNEQSQDHQDGEIKEGESVMKPEKHLSSKHIEKPTLIPPPSNLIFETMNQRKEAIPKSTKEIEAREDILLNQDEVVVDHSDNGSNSAKEE